jgi:Holliday junction resolvase RusA-like endonuclease
MLLFEFVIEGPPTSSQARRRETRDEWDARVKAAARSLWSEDRPLIASEVTVTMTHFFEGAPGDVDNIPKAVLDALKGVVLVDDRQVSDLIIQRRPLAGPYIVTAPSAEPMRRVGLGREFLHIAIATPPDHGELMTTADADTRSSSSPGAATSLHSYPAILQISSHGETTNTLS